MDDTPPKRILVIDDEAVVLEVVQSCFEDLAGWQVFTARSAIAGLDLIRTEPLDALVLDAMMPTVDGLTLLRQLRADSDLPSLPVVLLTASTDIAESDELSGLGVLGAIAKPFDPLDLIDQVATFLNWPLSQTSL
ncbi:MAG: response regulator [Kaiparowitsia implicata GSE-PSE-MK54-09C]|jgi:CheY-like chemotaxis protein|nr:response regulator [Kaiparowitsia implicata GSE-PSE-MK54-09C]